MGSSSKTATLLLTRKDVAAVLPIAACIDAVERAFVLHHQGRAIAPAVLGLQAPDGGFHVKAAGLALDRDYIAVKINANFPQNPQRHGLPTIQGVVALFDARIGAPLALMDSMELTALRTAAATAVATRHLARPDSRRAAIVGCGVQARAQLRALVQIVPLASVAAYDLEVGRARSFAAAMGAELGLAVTVAGSVAEAVREADLCVTCSSARTPILCAGDVPPGTFVAAVGADNPEKHEIHPDLFARATVVVDLLDQCAEIGDLRHALAAGTITRAEVHAQLAEVVTGAKRGRTRADEITLFDSTGTALQDVAAAALAYERAVETGLGVSVDLAA
jgi:alanine dehydrogenase